jgi:hypothetical protein
MLNMFNKVYGIEKIVSHLLMDQMKSFSGYELIDDSNKNIKSCGMCAAGESARKYTKKTAMP